MAECTQEKTVQDENQLNIQEEFDIQEEVEVQEAVENQDNVSFSIGDTFSSHEDFVKKLDSYEKSKFVQFWKRDARTIEAAKKRLDRYLNPSLKYYELKMCCIHGGQAFRSKGSGIRNSSTFKQECPVHIRLGVDTSGNFLEVRSVCITHNHAISQELYKHLPQQRRLSKEETKKAADLLQLKANKKLVQQQICTETGNVVLLKDLTNIALAARRGKSRNDLDSVVEVLIEKHGCTVEIYSDSDSNFRGMFFQDGEMKDAFKAYPEILFIDATYKLLELGLPVYLTLSEDLNGQSEITCVCILVSDDADSW